MMDDGKQWIAEAVDAVKLKFVRQGSELESSIEGSPVEYTHQVFGQSETIFGYKNPKLTIFFSSARLNALAKFTYDAVRPSESIDSEEPDIVIATLQPWMITDSFTTNMDQFSSDLNNEDEFRPEGNLVTTYSSPTATDNTTTTTYEVYQGDHTMEGFVKYHQKAESLLWWYIEAAQRIELDDDLASRWNLYHVFERRDNAGVLQYSFVGLATVCAFYAYPEHVRPRISQVMIIPTYQRKGHASKLLNAVYNHCQLQFKDKIIDFTVEDPSPDFTRLRDHVDCKNCFEAFPDPKFYKSDISTVTAQIKAKLKLSTPQIRRVFEILQLHLVTGSTMKEFRLTIKKRLMQPHVKQKKEKQKQEAVMSPEEQQALMKTDDDLINAIHTEYEGIVENYREVLKGLTL